MNQGAHSMREGWTVARGNCAATRYAAKGDHTQSTEFLGIIASWDLVDAVCFFDFGMFRISIYNSQVLFPNFVALLTGILHLFDCSCVTYRSVSPFFSWGFGATISACEKLGLWLQALDVMVAMNSADISPDAISCSACIATCNNPMAIVWNCECQLRISKPPPPTPEGPEGFQ